MAHYETIFKNGTLVNQDGVHRADIGVSAGRVAALGDLGASSADTIVDCTGLLPHAHQLVHPGGVGCTVACVSRIAHGS